VSQDFKSIGGVHEGRDGFPGQLANMNFFWTLIAFVTSLHGCLPKVTDLTSSHMPYISPTYLLLVFVFMTPLLYTLTFHNFLFLELIFCKGLIFY
jgi:hypothetical protein